MADAEALSRTRDEEVLRLIRAARFREAYGIAEATGIRGRWLEGEDANMYGRLIRGLGASREAAALHLRAYRRQPGCGGLTIQAGSQIHSFRGPLAAWKFYEAVTSEKRDEIGEGNYGELLAQMAFVAGCWRDFEKADALLDEATSAAPDSTWVMVQRSAVARQRDDFEEAMENIDAVLQIRPYYRPATEWKADLLRDLGRDEEAVEFAEDALEKVESLSLISILSAIHSEREKHAEALEAIDRFEALATLADKFTRKWIAGRRANLHYRMGRYELVPKLADESGNDALKEIAAKLRARGDGPVKRVKLDVPFVQQHHMTCAPATLTALCGYWKRPADHLEIVESICYDGTPWASERRWAEEQGFTVREFRADWETARSLIDRGIPFTLTTAEPTSAHLQAVIGYDETAETIIIRDPMEAHFRETVAGSFFEGYAACGPRAMLFLPPEDAGRLDGLGDLPDERYYDLNYRLQLALEAHDRDAAGEFVAEMEAPEPGHRMVYEAHFSLACYDGDDRALLSAVGEQVKLFPKDQALMLRRFNALQRLSMEAEQRPLAEEAVRRDAIHPVFYTVYANLISADARLLGEAAYYYRKAIRSSPSEGEAYQRYASLLWGAGDLGRSTPLYRIASTLGRTNERWAMNYFLARRHTGGTEGALAYLRQRFDLYGDKNSGPAITLADAYDRLSREPEAIAVVEEALLRRPEDGDLLLYAASTYLGVGRLERAQEMLDKAKGRCDRVRWARHAAGLATVCGDREGREMHWRSVLESDPLAIDAHRALARLAAEKGALDDDVAYFAEQCEKFPFYRPLHEDFVGYLRYEKRREEALAAIAHLLSLNEDNHWARRERIIVCSQLDRFSEVESDVEELLRRDPDESSTHSVIASYHRDRGDREGEERHFRRAIELSVDNDYAVRSYVFGGANHAEKKARVAFVQKELERQPIYGDAVFGFRDAAGTVLSSEETAETFRAIAEARPDLWQIWSARITDLSDRGKAGEALELAEEATGRFPLLPRLWYDLAEAQRANGDRPARIEALRRAIELSPAWNWVKRELAMALDDTGEREEALGILERCIADAPLDAANHTALADLLKRNGDDAAAYAAVRRAVEIDSSAGWAWDKLIVWSGGDDEARSSLKALAEDRVATAPDDEAGWHVLARLHGLADDPEGACEVLRKGLLANPDSEELRIDLGRRLFALGRFDEARSMCSENLPEGPGRRTLLKQAAQFDWDSGRKKEALAAMESLLEEHADYIDGAALIGDWYLDQGPIPKAVQWARRLVELAPGAAHSYGYLGDALAAAGKKFEAAEALEHAFDLDSEYRFGGEQALLLHIEARRYKGAKALLGRLEHVSPSPRNLVFGAKLAFAEKRFDDAMAFLGAAFRADTEDYWVVSEAVASIPGDRWADAAVLDLERALASGEVKNPRAGIAFVDFQMARGSAGKLSQKLAGFPLDGEVEKWTWHHFISRLGDTGKGKLLKRLMAQERERLTKIPVLWGVVGYSLFSLRNYKGCVAWMADWRSREGLEAWMLSNYLLAASGEKAPVREMQDVAEFAATQLPRAQTTSFHCASLAMYDAVRGDDDRARAWLGGVNDADLAPSWKFCAELARAGVALRAEGDPVKAGHHLRKAKEADPSWNQESWSRRHWDDWYGAHKVVLGKSRTLSKEVRALKRTRKKITSPWIWRVLLVLWAIKIIYDALSE